MSPGSSVPLSFFNDFNFLLTVGDCVGCCGSIMV